MRESANEGWQRRVRRMRGRDVVMGECSDYRGAVGTPRGAGDLKGTTAADHVSDGDHVAAAIEHDPGAQAVTARDLDDLGRARAYAETE